MTVFLCVDLQNLDVILEYLLKDMLGFGNIYGVKSYRGELPFDP